MSDQITKTELDKKENMIHPAILKVTSGLESKILELEIRIKELEQGTKREL